jgi:hypothetical protein
MCVVFLLVFAGLLLIGCDKFQEPVSPTEQSQNQPGPLKKNMERQFTGTVTPIESLEPGITKYPDGKMTMRGIVVKVVWAVSFSDGGTDLVSGPGLLELNTNTDPGAGTGFWWGKLTLMPEAPEAQGGQYQITWRGKATLGPSALPGGLEWTMNFQCQGHGEGGALDGIQISAPLIVTSVPDFSAWAGVLPEGHIKTH